MQAKIAVEGKHFNLPDFSWPKTFSNHAGIGANIEMSAKAEVYLCELSDDRKLDHHCNDRVETVF